MAMIKKILVASGMVAVALASVPATAAVITFDDHGSGQRTINNGYQGFNWNNFITLDTSTYSPSGYVNGVVSHSNVAFNANGTPATISNAAGFTLNNAYFTAAWNDGLTINAVGTTLDSQILNYSFTVDTSGPANILFNWTNLASVRFTTSGGANAGYNGSGSHFALDNLTVNEAIGVVPEPATLAIVGLGLFGFAAARRRKQ